MTVYDCIEIGENPIGANAVVFLDGPRSKPVRCVVESASVYIGDDGSAQVDVCVVERNGTRWPADGHSVRLTGPVLG